MEGRWREIEDLYHRALDLAAQSLAKDPGRFSKGQFVGSYEVLALLGAGSMGQVIRARDARLKRDVAIKVLPVEFDVAPDGRFLLMKAVPAEPAIQIVLNWTEELKRLVPRTKTHNPSP